MSYANLGPTVVAYPLATSIYDYIRRMLDLGATEGDPGSMELPHNVWEIVEALHRVLAGGNVDVTVNDPGNPDIVNELNRRVQQGIEDANEINGKVGFYLTALP